MWWRFTTSATCYNTISKTTTQETSLGQVTAIALDDLYVCGRSCLLQRWMIVRLLGVRLSTLKSSALLLCEPCRVEYYPCCMIRVALGILCCIHLRVLRTRRLRRLGCFAALPALLTCAYWKYFGGFMHAHCSFFDWKAFVYLSPGG